MSRPNHHRPGWYIVIRQAIAVVGTLVVVVACCLPALAQEAAVDYLEPRIDRQQFQALCKALNLGSEQKSIAELLYAEYSSAIADLAQKLDEKAEQAGRKTVQAALTGTQRIAPEELRQLRAAVLRVYQQGWPELDAATQNLLDSLRAVLTAEQQPAFDVALLELHRKILLHPRQSASGYQEYAGDGVDVLLLFAEATREGGELHGLDRESVSGILSVYEHALDALLVQTAADHRQGKLLRKIAEIEKDAAAARREEQAALKHWQQLYQLNHSTVQQIGEVAAATLGPEAQQLWLERFDQASFTWLYPRRKPDRQIEWILERRDVTDQQRENASAIYEQYVAQRKALSRQAIDLMIRGRLELQSMIYAMMDPASIDDRVRRGIYDELLKNSGELATLEASTSAALESLLTDAQRDALREAMRRPDAPRRRR